MAQPQATRLPAFARYWWLAAVRGLVTLRFALAVRPRRGARLGLVAGMAAVAGALLVLLRHRLAGLVQPDLLVELPGVSALLSGTLLTAEGLRLRRFAGTFRS